MPHPLVFESNLSMLLFGYNQFPTPLMVRRTATYRGYDRRNTFFLSTTEPSVYIN